MIERVLKRHRRLQSHLEHALSQHISPQVQQENDHRKSHNLQIEYHQEIYQTSHSQLICLMIIEIQQDSQITIYNSAMPAPLLVGLEHSEYQQEHISLLGLNEQITIECKDYYLSSEQSLHIASDGIFEQKLSQRQQKQIQNQEKTTRGTYLWESSLNIKDDKTLVNIYLADPISEL
ncbi:hypothetical protein PDPE_1-00931 [Photobacterium damselae subsp. piscicida]|uniref:SpoIIE family protein phosphatase n=1 Tax=Photobacterium damselae TaxID=38293 RepID=UPI0002F78BC6|nr:SpoIIE family protein phosphatase [Photobacterium damselae]OLQ82032.1 hypothetical protein BEI67_01260 [Photobacterium damselae subsp. piscicida]BBC40091.1 hypothetical protein PDPE_1-00931 [Photobacterium damselae subsp. piscicida]